RNLVHLRLQVLVQNFDGAMALCAFQSQDSDLRERSQQIQILLPVGRSLGAQNQEGQQVAFMCQRLGNFPSQLLQLLLGGKKRQTGPAPGIHHFPILEGFNQGTIERQFVLRRDRAEGIGQHKPRGLSLPKVHRSANDAEQLRGRLQQAFGQGQGVYQLLNRLAEPVQSFVQLGFFPKETAIEDFLEPASRQVQDQHENERRRADRQRFRKLRLGLKDKGADEKDG